MVKPRKMHTILSSEKLKVALKSLALPDSENCSVQLMCASLKPRKFLFVPLFSRDDIDGDRYTVTV